jgi:hypothetical protein
MAGSYTGTINYNNLQHAEIPNFSEMYMQVGMELTKRYWQNRQNYSANIANPLSKINALDEHKGLLSEIKNDYISQFEKFNEEGNWHRAGSAIFEAVDSITNNEGLKAIISSYENYSSLLKDENFKSYDATTQDGIVKASKLNSQPIVYDKENNIASGGFTAINFGKFNDFSELRKSIIDAVSKMPANVTEQQFVREFGDMLEIDGRRIHEAWKTFNTKTEILTPARIENFAVSMMTLTPEYENQSRFLTRMKAISSKFRKNKDGSYFFEDMNGHDIQPLIIQGAPEDWLSFQGVAVSDIFTYKDVKDKNGQVIDKERVVRKDLPASAQQLINNVYDKYGISLTDFLENKLSPEQGKAISEEILNTQITILDNQYKQYLSEHNLEDNKTNKDNYYLSKYEDIVYTNQITDFAKSLGIAFYKYNVKRAEDIKPNSNYGIGLKILNYRKKQQQEEASKYQEALTYAGTTEVKSYVTSMNERKKGLQQLINQKQTELKNLKIGDMPAHGDVNRITQADITTTSSAELRQAAAINEEIAKYKGQLQQDKDNALAVIRGLSNAQIEKIIDENYRTTTKSANEDRDFTEEEVGDLVKRWVENDYDIEKTVSYYDKSSFNNNVSRKYAKEYLYYLLEQTTDNAKSFWDNVLGTTLIGGGAGGGIGTYVTPGIGTGIGAAIGLGVGFLGGIGYNTIDQFIVQGSNYASPEQFQDAFLIAAADLDDADIKNKVSSLSKRYAITAGKEGYSPGIMYASIMPLEGVVKNGGVGITINKDGKVKRLVDDEDALEALSAYFNGYKSSAGKKDLSNSEVSNVTIQPLVHGERDKEGNLQMGYVITQRDGNGKNINSYTAWLQTNDTKFSGFLETFISDINKQQDAIKKENPQLHESLNNDKLIATKSLADINISLHDNNKYSTIPSLIQNVKTMPEGTELSLDMYYTGVNIDPDLKLDILGYGKGNYKYFINAYDGETKLNVNNAAEHGVEPITDKYLLYRSPIDIIPFDTLEDAEAAKYKGGGTIVTNKNDSTRLNVFRKNNNIHIADLVVSVRDGKLELVDYIDDGKTLSGEIPVNVLFTRITNGIVTSKIK